MHASSLRGLPLLGLGLAALVAADAAQAAGAPAAGFDKPDKLVHLPLGGGSKDAKLGTFCAYFSHFMVKEVQAGEEGAELLAIQPIATPGKLPPCQRKLQPGETAIPADQWDGSFKGLKGDYVVFDASDGVNGGLGFAVFSASTGKKLFEDVAVGSMTAAALDTGALKLAYTRAFAGKCSVIAEGAGCWTSIAEAAGLKDAAAPDCAAGYKAGKLDLAKGRCQAQRHAGPKCLETELKGVEDQHFDQAPSVVEYQVETVIDATHQAVQAKPGPLVCHASD